MVAHVKIESCIGGAVVRRSLNLGSVRPWLPEGSGLNRTHGQVMTRGTGTLSPGPRSDEKCLTIPRSRFAGAYSHEASAYSVWGDYSHCTDKAVSLPGQMYILPNRLAHAQELPAG